MRLSILITTLGRRSEKLQRLLYNDLLPQVEGRDDVEVVAYWNNREKTLGQLRQALVEEAKGEYICFVDDDDFLPEYYIEEIIGHLDGADYVGWRMQCTQDGKNLPPTFHSLRYDGWSDDADGFYRDVSHLNPVRRELALKADFRKGGMPEDRSWASQLKPHLKTESFIDKIMYYYVADSVDCSWKLDSPGARPYSPLAFTRPTINSSVFRWHPDSSGW